MSIMVLRTSADLIASWQTTRNSAQPFLGSFVSISHHPHTIVTLEYGKNELCFLFSKLLSSISLLLCAPKSNEWFDCYSARVEARLQQNIGNTSRPVLMVFMRSGITPPKVSRFGWNLEHSQHILWGWLLQILGAIRAVAIAEEPH